MLFTRPDGTLCRDVPPFRRMMPFLMRGRNESAVYFEQEIDLTRTNTFIERWNAAHPERKVTVFHVFMWAALRAARERPRINRFVMGSRIWQRDGFWISFSAKKRLADGSPIVVLKRRFDLDATFEQTVRHLYGDLVEGRGDKPSHVDKELGFFLKLPAILLRLGVAVLHWLDRWNLLPGSFIHGDPLYASLFVANLGSVRLESAYHHLYEYGNCPLFVTIGRARTTVTPDGPRFTCSIKYTFDERVEDGLYCASALELIKQTMENPGAIASGAAPEPPLALASGA